MSERVWSEDGSEGIGTRINEGPDQHENEGV